MVYSVAHFLFGVASGVANEDKIGLNNPLPIKYCFEIILKEKLTKV